MPKAPQERASKPIRLTEKVQSLHAKSSRANDVFISVDLGSITETLFESEMFGHVKGAFTDAKENKAGRFEIASGGTLFMDEIGNLPLQSQAKLLSVIQSKQVVRVGSSTPLPFDTRLISATNIDLHLLGDEKKFREDLLYRINTIQIEIPPLRERLEDISIIANFYLQKFSEKYKKDNFQLAPDAIKTLQKHSWPGNVRELEHCIEKAVIMADSNIIKSNDIDFAKSGKSAKTIDSLNLEENEIEIIKEAISKHSGNMSLTAKKLGINRSTLYAKIKKYDI